LWQQLAAFAMSTLTFGLMTIMLMSSVFPSKAIGWLNYSPQKNWNDFTLDWFGDDDDLNNGLVSGAKTQVTNAVNQWDDFVTGSQMNLTASQSSGDIDIVPLDFSTLGWDNVPGNTTWNGGSPITYSVAWLNKDFTWHTDGTMNENTDDADVRTITAHEVGHALGWNHKIDALGSGCDSSGTGEGKVTHSSVMCVDWTQQWSTSSDDRNGMQNKY
jgi:hypothetical protein